MIQRKIPPADRIPVVDESIERTRLARVNNLRALAASMDPDRPGKPLGWTGLAKRCGVSPNYLMQLAGPNPTRSCGEKAARSIERRCGLMAGWLDISR